MKSPLPPKPSHQSFFALFRRNYLESQNNILKKHLLSSVFIVLMYISWLSLFSLYTLFNKIIILFVLIIYIFFYLIILLLKAIYKENSYGAVLYQLAGSVLIDLAQALGLCIEVGIITLRTVSTFIKQNIIISIIISAYTLIILSQLHWGIPNNTHPFSYHMDEWAMVQSVRFTFRYGTPNIQGGSHGVVLFYFLSGLYLIPAILLHIVNPFLIKNSLQNIPMQYRLFEIFRLNTLLYGITTCLLIVYIVRKYFQSSPVISLMVFVTTPIFICLSIFFKYDIALVCWLTLTILFSLRYQKKPTQNNYYLLSCISALTLAIKLSALPVFLMLILSFFLFTPTEKRKRKLLIWGLVIFFIVFLCTGIPDLFYAMSQYKVWLYANLISAPFHDSNNLSLGLPIWVFLLFFEYPALFGHALFILFYVCIFYYLFSLLFWHKHKDAADYRKTGFFLIFSIIFFVVSLIPLKIGAGGNRALVFLPFITLFISLIYKQVSRSLSRTYKFILTFCLCVMFVIQIIELIPWIAIKYFPNPQESASIWIEQHIPKKSLISIENVPIFQGVPDIILKDFYTSQYFPHAHTRYTYQVMDNKTNKFGRFAIVSDLTEGITYEKNSVKKTIYKNLQKLRYKQVARFTPNVLYLPFFDTKSAYYFSGLIPGPTIISIFSNYKIQ